MNYQLVTWFPDFLGASYQKRFFNRPVVDGFTTLSAGIFWWLINICPGYLVFWQGIICTSEPYLPNRLARQFGYDQLYVPELMPLFQRQFVRRSKGMVLQCGWRNRRKIQPTTEDTKLLRQPWIMCMVCNSKLSTGGYNINTLALGGSRLCFKPRRAPRIPV